MEFKFKGEENKLENACDCESLSEFFGLRKKVNHSLRKCDFLYMFWEEDKSPDLLEIYAIESLKVDNMLANYGSKITSLRRAGKIGIEDGHFVYCNSCESFIGELR